MALASADTPMYRGTNLNSPELPSSGRLSQRPEERSNEGRFQGQVCVRNGVGGFLQAQSIFERTCRFVIDEVPVEADRETALGGFPLEHCPFFAICRPRKRFRQ